MRTNISPRVFVHCNAVCQDCSLQNGKSCLEYHGVESIQDWCKDCRDAVKVDISPAMQYYAIRVIGNRSQWSIPLLADPEHAKAWQEDGLQVEKLNHEEVRR